MATSSFEKINYNIRVNKSVERKMMCEALSRLCFIDQLKNYTYIGFGSPYFADFSLFHKNLGINDLISIEKEEAKKNRFEFNIPNAGIKMHYGLSTTILPNLELETKKSILWLDYDDKISDFMFSDTATFFSTAMPGSFFIISLNVQEEIMSIEDVSAGNQISLKEFRLNKIIDSVGRERYPNEFMELNLNTRNLTKVAYEMLNRQIITTLNTRNGAKKRNKVYYQQLFNFIYKDNATILTIGGLLYNSLNRHQISNMALDDLHFIRKSDEPYKIQCPNLTYREVKALDGVLPSSTEMHSGKFVNTKLQKIPLIPTDIKKYAEIYRYYPNFAEANI